MSDTTTLPATIQAQAKARALKIIEANPGCTSYVRPEDLETQSVFVPVVSVIKPSKEDFYDPIPKIGIMAKPMLMNLLREKAGIDIIRTETSKRAEHIWVTQVWGQKRQPDGTMLSDSASYEFNADERAEADILSKPGNYQTETTKRLHVLEVAKFGEQRAVTGATHALICKMAKVARAFKSPEELMRGMIVCRVDRNIDGMLADPEMRKLAMNQALGITEQLYGPKPLAIAADPETMSGGVEAAQQGEAEGPEDDIDFGGGSKEPAPWEEKSPAEQFIALLENVGQKNREAGMRWLETKPTDAAILDAIKKTNATIDKREAAKQAAEGASA